MIRYSTADTAFIVSCEHGGNNVPSKYKNLFSKGRQDLERHQGYDLGALRIARSASKALGSKLYYSEVTRLLIDLNRSLSNRNLFSMYTKPMEAEEKKRLKESYYLPYRSAVENEIATLLSRSDMIIHLSIHSFTPVLKGVKRNADIGLLYDPARKKEKELAGQLKNAIIAQNPGLIVRYNYPYLGTSDGFVPYLRKVFGKPYIGMEFEFNQRLNSSKGAPEPEFEKQLIQAFHLLKSDE